MADRFAELLERGKALSTDDRMKLIELLRETLDEPLDPSTEDLWRSEIRRRTAAYAGGKATLHDADDVIAEASRSIR